MSRSHAFLPPAKRQMPSMTVADELVRLLEKYRCMRGLRALSRTPCDPEQAPSREDLRRLSHEFPGALAELDRISDELLEERCSVLECLVTDSQFASIAKGDAPTTENLPSWLRGWLYVHSSLRGALACKAWLAGQRVITAAVEEQLLSELHTLPFPEEARVWVPRLSQVANPPRGRLLDLVFDSAARLLGVERDHVPTLLMPRPPELSSKQT